MKEEKKLTHWRKLADPDWIGTYVLPEEKPINVKLISVKWEEVKVKGVKDWYLVGYFDKNEWFDKPMLLSANTNRERLAALIGTPYVEKWVKLDLWVTLQQEWDTAWGGGKDWALRIAEKAPVMSKPKLTPDMPKYKDAIKHLKSGGKIDDITKGWDVDVKKLQDAAKI